MSIAGGAGVLLSRRGLLGDRAVDGLKALITTLTLPILVFRAMRLPDPETRLLFQGYEAGMLGDAFFAALHTSERLPAFAALDMGQAIYIFTVLLVQMSILEQRRVRELAGAAGNGSESGSSIVFPWPDVVASKVLWAILGGLTTPLVCLAIGASLAGGIPRDPAIVKIAALRTLAGLGLAFGLLIIPALGFPQWYSKAAIVLFVLPAPFVIPVYYKRNATFIGSALTLATVVSIVLIAVLAVLGLA